MPRHMSGLDRCQTSRPALTSKRPAATLARPNSHSRLYARHQHWSFGLNGSLVVYLVGFAGTGKLTIARALAPSINAIVVDNHWINNPIFGLIDPDGVTPLPMDVWVQVGKVREAVLETVATLAKPGRNFIFTHEGLEGRHRDQEILDAIRNTAARRGAALRAGSSALRRGGTGAPYPVARTRFDAERHRSGATPLRKSRHSKVLDPKLPGTLSLDVTASTPADSAAAVQAHIRALRLAGETAATP